MNLEFTIFLQPVDTSLFDNETQKNTTFYFTPLKNQKYITTSTTIDMLKNIIKYTKIAKGTTKWIITPSNREENKFIKDNNGLHMKSNCIKLEYIHNDTKYILHLNLSIILSDKYAICLKFSEFERNKIIEDYATQNLHYSCIYKISVVCRINIKHKKPLTKYQIYKK